jgi:hypothetical protein
MADQRSVMKEYRLLEQKRQAGGLSPQEEARFAQLRDLVGPDTGVAASRPGFDVNAAAARLRESLLPAGLRNRPAPPPEAAPEPPAPEPFPETPADSGSGLEAVWNAAPFAPLAEQPGLAEDSLFDPGTLGLDAPAEPAWDPNAQPYDPSAQPYDPSAQAYAGGEQAWDPNAQPYDPNAPQQWDAGAQPYDPNAQPYDPNAQPYDPNAQPYDPNAQPYDPNAPQPWDAGGAQGWDAGAQPGDPNAQPWDPNAAAQWDAAVQPAMDPGLAAPWGEQPGEATPEPAPATEQAEPEWSAEGVPTEPAGEAAAWDMTALAAEEPPAAEPEWDAGGDSSEAPLEAEPAVEPALEGGEGFPSYEPQATDLAAEGEPIPEPPLESTVEGLLPFDAEAASAVEPESAPEGWGAVDPAVDMEMAVSEPTVDVGAPSPELPLAADDGTYGDLAGPEQPSLVDSLSTEDAQGLLAPLGAGQELTSDDDAFAQGFQLESNGSFGKAASPSAPAWNADPTAGEAEPWESAPALDLGAMGPAGDVPPIDLSPPMAAPDLHAPPLGLEPLDALEEVDVEEIPIVEGAEELLEEVPAEPALAAQLRVTGSHRVVVHTVEGLVKRGVIADVSLDAPSLPLAPQPDAAPEALPTAKVKAIFFMLAAGEPPPVAAGKKVRVTFSDGRQIAGFSPDYSDAGPGFFMIPADTRTNTGRIWVYRSAVKAVSVS